MFTISSSEARVVSNIIGRYTYLDIVRQDESESGISCTVGLFCMVQRKNQEEHREQPIDDNNYYT